MHSSLVRLQNVFGFFTTVAFTIAALIAVSDIIAERMPSVTVTIDKVQVYAIPVAFFPTHSSVLDVTIELFFWNTMFNGDYDGYYDRMRTNGKIGYEADPITTTTNWKNTPTSASPSMLISPPSSTGTPNKYSSMFLPSGLQIQILQPPPRISRKVWERRRHTMKL
jgi:hypothetical protein